MAAATSPDEPQLRWLRRAPEGIAPADARPGRLGVLSGTFNPPTCAHVELARRALEHLPLDEVLFVLPEVPPHKQELEASLDDRAAMLVAAIAAAPKFSAAIATHGLLLEIHRALVPHYPPVTRVFFLTGRDAAQRILLEWPYEQPERALEEMFSRFEFVVAQRGGPFVVPADSPAARYAAGIHPLAMPDELERLSATLARERVARGEAPEEVVPLEVAAYIASRGLYRKARRTER